MCRRWPPTDPATPGLSRPYPYKLRDLLAARYTSQTIALFNGCSGGAARRAAGLSTYAGIIRSRFEFAP